MKPKWTAFEYSAFAAKDMLELQGLFAQPGAEYWVDETLDYKYKVLGVWPENEPEVFDPRTNEADASVILEILIEKFHCHVSFQQDDNEASIVNEDYHIYASTLMEAVDNFCYQLFLQKQKTKLTAK